MELNWASLKAGLGDSRTRTGVCGTYPKEELFDPDKYAQVCDQISREVGQLADVKDDMKQLKDKIGGTDSAITAYLAVLDVTDKVKADFEANAKPQRNVTAEALEIAATGAELVSVFAPEKVGKGAEFVGGALSLAGEITSLVEGDEQGESAVHAPATLDPGELATEMQNRLAAASAAFDHAWDMLISDPEKLNTAHENFTLDPRNRNNDPECAQPGKTCGIWMNVPGDVDHKKPMMQNGVRHWAAGKFMAATYDVWLVPTVQINRYRDVTTSDLPSIGCYVSQVSKDWRPFTSAPPDAGYYFRDKWGLSVSYQPSSQFPRRNGPFAGTTSGCSLRAPTSGIAAQAGPIRRSRC